MWERIEKHKELRAVTMTVSMVEYVALEFGYGWKGPGMQSNTHCYKREQKLFRNKSVLMVECLTLAGIFDIKQKETFYFKCIPGENS